MAGKAFSIPSRQLVDHHYATDWWSYLLGGGEVPATPCVPPTVNDFRAQFPEIVSAGVTDNQIAQALLDANFAADTSWVDNCARAIALLAAHYLVLGILARESMPEPSEDDGGGTVIGGGQVTSIMFETMKVGFSSTKFAAGSAGGGGTGGGPGEGPYTLEMTGYGQMYLDMLDRNVPAIMVV